MLILVGTCHFSLIAILVDISHISSPTTLHKNRLSKANCQSGQSIIIMCLIFTNPGMCESVKRKRNAEIMYIVLIHSCTIIAFLFFP